MTDLVSLIKTGQFLGTWMIVMLVTFADAYLEEAFLLLIAGGFQGSSLPKAATDDLTDKWVKGLIRGGNPHTWIKQLEQFGATGYEAELAGKMQTIWKRRHEIAHTAEPEINQTASQEFLDALRLVNGFVETTDRFILKARPMA